MSLPTEEESLRERLSLILIPQLSDKATQIEDIINLIKQHDQYVIGEKLSEEDGWDFFFSEEARCCPGDDFAYYGNQLKAEQRKRAEASYGTEEK